MEAIGYGILSLAGLYSLAFPSARFRLLDLAFSFVPDPKGVAPGSIFE